MGDYSKVIFVFSDSTVYGIQCSMESGDKDNGLDDDIKRMLDTFELK